MTVVHPQEPGGAARILFICNQNAVRSPMAEALLNQLGAAPSGPGLTAESVGLEAGALDAFSVAVLQECGIDIESFRPRALADIGRRDFDLVVALAMPAYERALETGLCAPERCEYWPTMDPAAVEGNRDTRLSAYRMVRDQLTERIVRRFGLAAAAKAPL